MDGEKSLSNERKPMMLIFAGPNGSGKSTITEYFSKVGQYTNADEMVRVSHISNEEAAVKADQLRYESIQKQEDLTFETVLSSEYKINILKAAKEAGYFIKCIFVLTADVNLNIARVQSRVAQGGHSVDPEKIRSRYKKSIANIRVLMDLCDILHVYDNTGKKPLRIIRKHKEEITIFPNDNWDQSTILKMIE